MTKIQVGNRAPDFSATTQDGQRICLHDFLGKKALILFFYPRTAHRCARKRVHSVILT